MSAPYKPTPQEEATASTSSYLSSSSPRTPHTTTTSSSSSSRSVPEDPSKPEDFISVMSNKTPSKFTDPCAHAAKLSMKCLDDNAYDRTKCADVFNQYRQCKKTWINQRRQDRLNNRPGAFD
ncbi:related to COX23 - protein with function in mitochondrial copper homeostasis [Ustilago trichophora]|uniref:Related to COX23 - protein with function in mitochondrial copper homeostasis n=1 Tax=Ustilago trichophora TaxID=86804 RepID=A0A5C3EHA3_9BASI|nr:related to COX23 - protein with function in mitochondrial copper homeostasis [Ustilago trichophora]